MLQSIRIAHFVFLKTFFLSFIFGVIFAIIIGKTISVVFGVRGDPLFWCAHLKLLTSSICLDIIISLIWI